MSYSIFVFVWCFKYFVFITYVLNPTMILQAFFSLYYTRLQYEKWKCFLLFYILRINIWIMGKFGRLWCKSIVKSHYQLLRSFEMPFCCLLKHLTFLRNGFTITYCKFVPKVFYITEKHVTYVINTKLHSCFDIARHIALVRYAPSLSMYPSFLIMNSCYLSYCIKICVVLYIYWNIKH